MLVLGMKTKALNQIAVVELDGQIGARLKAGDYVKLFRSLEENDRIRAVVLDVDSPGGSVTGSNYLYQGVKSLAKKKPVISFIRGLGASGSYLFSCPANRIIAMPTSLIGSIGVMSMHPQVHEALHRIGVQMNVIKSDKLKDIGSPFREPTPEETQKEQELVDDLYDQFLDAVAEGRRMDKAEVRKVATGEVFTGRKAITLGLIDELGDLDRAIDVAAELGKVARKPVWLRPKKGLRDVMSSMVTAPFVNEIMTQVEERLSGGGRSYYYR